MTDFLPVPTVVDDVRIVAMENFGGDVLVVVTKSKLDGGSGYWMTRSTLPNDDLGHHLLRSPDYLRHLALNHWDSLAHAYCPDLPVAFLERTRHARQRGRIRRGGRIWPRVGRRMAGK